MGLDKVKKTPCGFCFVEYPYELTPYSNYASLGLLVNKARFNLMYLVDVFYFVITKVDANYIYL